MSLMYVLPPRTMVGQRLAEFLGGMLPGLEWDESARLGLAEALESAATARPDVYVIFREEIADGEDVTEALVDRFGAEDGDEVIEVRANSDRIESVCWTLGSTRAA